MWRRTRQCLVLLMAVIAGCLFGRAAQAPSIEILPENGKYLYQLGDTALMNIRVWAPGSLEGVSRVAYRLSEDGIVILAEGELELKRGAGKLRGTMDKPGFLRCDLSWIVGDDTLRAACGCGFSVEAIRPTGRLPENFDSFWREARAELLRIPVEARLEEVAVVDSGDARRFKVSLANVNGTRVYGWLHLPEGRGPFPTVLSIPGSGVGRTGRFAGFTQAGMAVLAIEVHGLEQKNHEIVGAAQEIKPADDEIRYFVNLQNGLLAGYHSFGREDPYHYYHRRVLQGAMRALDYLCTRPDVDTSRIIVFGGSQGGGLSLLSAALDKRIKAVVATVPAFCDNTASLYARRNRPDSQGASDLAKIVRTMSYYDAALAAELIQSPTLIGVGFIDPTCPPTRVYSAYNNLKGRRTIENFYTTGHGSPPDWREKIINWLARQMEKGL
ncbi:MAG TPA: acetylxylan esterase [archaeon]|nr:acetylxylan esterase [archaeon]